MSPMSLRERLRSGRPVITSELVPPRGADADAVREQVATLRFADALNVTDLPQARTLALAAFEPPQAPSPSQVQLQAEAQSQIAALTEPLRQAYASTAPTDIGAPKLADPPKPKAASRPAPQKNYALLSDAQIAGIKERLKLSSAQESYWPPVETALRAVARKIHAKRQTDPAATGIPIDPDSDEVQQLKSAAMPLLYQLREDQKSEVRSLARIIGLEKVAAMI